MRVKLSRRNTPATSLSVLLFGLLALLLVACSSDPSSTVGPSPTATPASSNTTKPTEALDEGWAASSDVETVRALHYAVLDEDPAALLELLDAGADPDAKLDGLAPLHHAAAHNGNPAVTQALLDAGAEVDAKTYIDVTPLHGAAQLNDNPAVLQALLDAGADPDAKNVDGETPLDIAEDKGHPNAVEVLRGAASR